MVPDIKKNVKHIETRKHKNRNLLETKPKFNNSNEISLHNLTKIMKR